jgi:hypothetical protein
MWRALGRRSEPSLGALAAPFGYRTIGLARKIAHRKESTNLAFFGFFKQAQEFGIRAGLNGSAELGDSKTREVDAFREKSSIKRAVFGRNKV